MTNSIKPIPNLNPTTFEEAHQFAEMISKSDFAPPDYKNKPGNVIVAIQMSYELEIPIIQGLQNIAVINGRPAIWGDLALSLVKRSPECEDVVEWIEGSVESGNAVAHCKVQRRDQTEQTRSFSMKDAKSAGLLNKQGPWRNYTKRMLQMRARGFALRDIFPDVLKGMAIREEVADYTDIKSERAKLVSNFESKINGHAQANAHEEKQAPASQEEVLELAQEVLEITDGEYDDTHHIDGVILELIKEKSIPSQTIQSWLEKAEVDSLSDLSVDKKEKIVQYLGEL